MVNLKIYVVKWLPNFKTKSVRLFHMRTIITYNTYFVSAGSQGHTLPRSQATSYFLENSDSVLYESKKSGISSQPFTVCHAIAPDDRAQWKHDQAHVVSPPDSQPHT